MKIYFAGSIRGGRGDADMYMSMLDHLRTYGTVLTEHVADVNLTDAGESLTEEQIFSRDVAWIHEADVIVAEVSTPSLGVGYEIGIAETLGKKILCLYRPQEGKSLSAMIRGNTNVMIQEYSSIEDVEHIFKTFFKPNP